ncbi:hypothetical protein G7K_0915-t1 [Saitoella complicata NRRL Y-17804]|uniref:SGTA homodimerisation domain-containing protein n=1 Tax=Saitoella complicata (strain BCRC 22490 / CBS 7301 / JCM 7358 / NBRC 10748 / NRRL Y-17804) TaxID=698492 RepID=A0A0E9NAF6_SAICN|nr:hypothetical protein G7K_0915-t1 [Saitoella complicata NRRL Y-17804]
MSTKSDPAKRRLAFGIIDFLQDAMNDGTVTADDKDSIEVAVQCISDVFGIDASDETQRSTIGMGNQKLMQIFSVYEKTREKMGSQSIPSTSGPTGPSDEDKAKAEDLKSQGNAAMSRRDYPTAISLYTEALTLTPSNPIYLSNRAAAYSQSGQQDLAAADAQTAVDIDPKYGKGWSRLGHAKFAAGDAKGAMEAYRRGVEVDPSSEVMKKGYETAKKRVEEDEAEASSSSSPAERSTPAAGAGAGAGAGGMPDLSSLMGALGGGSSGGGMPDLSSMMQNPMIAQMAQNMMQSGALDSLLSNPRMAQMASQFQNGQMPNIGELMNDPEMRDMARNLMGSGAGGAPGAPGAGAGAGGR